MNEYYLLKEIQDLLKRVMAGMRRSIYAYLQLNGGHIERNVSYQRTYIRNMNILCFHINHLNEYLIFVIQPSIRWF